MEGRSKERRATGLTAKEAAELLGVDTGRVAVLAGQGRLKRDGGTADEPHYDLDSVTSMQVENLIREMLEEAGEKAPELREKIDKLATLQYYRGRLASEQAELWEMLEHGEKANEEAARQIAEQREMLEELRETEADMERQINELRAMEEGQLRRMPDKERGAG